MNLKHYVLAGAVAFGLAAPVSAATYDIASVMDGTDGAFGFSMFHDQTNSRMNGATIKDPSGVTSGGSWDDATGAISFGLTLFGGGTVTASGNLNYTGNTNTMAHGTGGQHGIGDLAEVTGSIAMTFLGAGTIADGTYNFQFNIGVDPTKGSNSFDTSDIHLNLWGDLPNYDAGACKKGTQTCIGADLRLGLRKVDPNNPSVVPLPASVLLLGTAVAGLGAVRRRKS